MRPGGTPRCASTVKLEERLTVLGGYAAESEAASLAASLGLPQKVLRRPLRTLSGGQRRRIELARILFSGADTLLLDEPTNHLDADSVSWLRDHLRSFRGGVVVISHDTELLESVVTKVFHLDADRSVLDIYNLGWKALPGPARDRRAAAPAGTAQRRAAGGRAAARRRTRCGRRRRRRRPRRACRSGPRNCWRALGRPRRGQGRPAPVPHARALRQDAAVGAAAVEVVWLA